RPPVRPLFTMEAPSAGRVPAEGAPTAAVAEVRCPGPAPLRLLEWRVSAGAAVRIGSVLAVFEAAASAQPAGAPQSRAVSGGCRRLRSERAGVPGQMGGRAVVRYRALWWAGAPQGTGR
ncbi:RNA polymerase II, partial [Saguinus oedipus]